MILAIRATTDQPRHVITYYKKQYAAQISLLYHTAVQSIQSNFYSQAQLNAWSRQPRSTKYWDVRLQRNQSWLAIDNRSNTCCAFISLDTCFPNKGYIDHLYVHPNYQGQGLATRLLNQLINWAKENAFDSLTLDASYQSQPLCVQQGFHTCYKSYQSKSGQMLPGFFMRKQL